MQAKYYSEETGIEKEKSLWDTFFGGDGAGTAGKGDDWSLDSISDGVMNLGVQLIAGIDSVADTIGTIGDLIPELIFGPEEEEYTKEELEKMTKGDKGQVVVGGNTRSMRLVKKRGHHQQQEERQAIAPLKTEDELDDEESNDWTKED